MLLTDFLTVAFIPPLISPILNSSSESENGVNFGPSSSLYSTSSELFGNEDFFNSDTLPKVSTLSQNRPYPISDKVLNEILEEEKRLDLAGISDDDMRSEEAREIIYFQRNRFQNNMEPKKSGRGLTFSLENEDGEQPFFNGPGNERFSAQYLSTENPGNIFTQRNIREQDEMVTTEAPPPPAMGRMSIGGAFGKVRGEIRNVVGNIRRTFWGSSQKETTTKKPLPTGNTILFPNEPDKDLPSIGSGIDFGSGQPDHYQNGPEAQPVTNVLNCNGSQTEYKGACYNVLQQEPCAKGEWLIEDSESGKGVCAINKCADKMNHAFFGGECVLVRMEGSCHKGMVTYIFKNGEVECDCKDEYLFNQRDGNCYPAYRRGPCREGEIFTTRITAKGTLPPTCIKNKCSQDGFFCNAPACPNDRNCIELKSKCPNGEGVLDIDPLTLTPKCIDFRTQLPGRIIGNVPTLACAPGSRRDILGTCRKPTKITFS